MLPDYPSLKKEISEVLQIVFRKRVENYTIGMREIPKTRVFEGKGMLIRRKTGEEDETSFMSSEIIFEIKMDEIPEMSINDLINKIDEAAREMAEKMETGFFKAISEVLDEKGQTVKQKGKPLSGKSILNVLDKIFIPFNKDGSPEMPTIFMHPNLTESMKKALSDLQSVPELKKEHDEIMQRKREEWRAEEASRKLVG
jgi:hypothetical protein